MTGSYASFKGKLKVGDMVRTCAGLEGIVTDVTDNGFDFRYSLEGTEADMWQPWGCKGTLELLMPSPTVAEEEWWKSEDYLGAITNEDEAAMVVPRIVAEAMRRGEEKAWEEARKMVAASNEAMSDMLETLHREAGDKASE